MGKFEYRLIKSSWGIAIDVIGDCKISYIEQKNKNLVYANTYLDLEIPTLLEEEKKFVVKGVK